MRWIKMVGLVTAMAAFGLVFIGALLKLPLPMVTVSSDSMYPLLQRGDLVLTMPAIPPLDTAELNYAPVADDRAATGPIVVFRVANGPWTIHRLVAGDSGAGFLTKGDANPARDQDYAGFPRVSPTAIQALVPTIAGQPLRLPLVGYVGLMMAEPSQNRYFLPGVGVLAVLVFVVGPRRHRIRRWRRSAHTNTDAVLPSLAVLVAVVVGATVVAKSVVLPMNYDVVTSVSQTYVGNDRSAVMLHDSVSRSIPIKNSGAIPLIFSISSSVLESQSSDSWIVLWPGQSDEVQLTFGAEVLGPHQGELTVAVFLPVLPPQVLHALNSVNFWLAVVAAAAAAGAPLLLLYVWGAGVVRRRPYRMVVRTAFAQGGW